MLGDVATAAPAVAAATAGLSFVVSVVALRSTRSQVRIAMAPGFTPDDDLRVLEVQNTGRQSVMIDSVGLVAPSGGTVVPDYRWMQQLTGIAPILPQTIAPGHSFKFYWRTATIASALKTPVNEVPMYPVATVGFGDGRRAYSGRSHSGHGWRARQCRTWRQGRATRRAGRLAKQAADGQD